MLERNNSGGVFNRFERSAHGQLIRSAHHGFYLFNARGDVVQRVDVVGVVLHVYVYCAFGNPLSENSETSTNPFRHNAEYLDFETGLVYLRNRFYDPSTGRFITEDPARWGRNWYVFASNNPIMFNDPLGLWDTARFNQARYVINPYGVNVYCPQQPGDGVIDIIPFGARVFWDGRNRPDSYVYVKYGRDHIAFINRNNLSATNPLPTFSPVPIVHDYIPISNKRRGTNITPTGVVIHSTGNPSSTARNERDWLTNPINTDSVAWHIVVDGTQAIVAIPLNERANHAGDGRNIQL